MQSRLFSPGYAGVGRWVLFDAATRRAFSAAGRDSVPEVLRILAERSAPPSSEPGPWRAGPVETGQLERLGEAGLLQEVPVGRYEGASTFVAWYQRATFDYPFHDYSAEGWRQQEVDLLERYAQAWSPPPSILERPGELVALPRHPLPQPPVTREDGVLDLDVLGWALEHSFGPIGQIPTRHVTCIRRTSPSGGARHPAELHVQLPKGLGMIPAGSYAYDVGRHGLLPCEPITAPGGGRGPVFVIRMRVERAMWRYRDLRALRPVLLDVGHITETLALLLHRAGFPTTLASPVIAPGPGAAWLEEPSAAVLHLNAPPHPPALVESAFGEPVLDGEWLTNPAATLGFTDGTLVGRAVWPAISEQVLDETGFLILNHCVPSTRGDRATDLKGITSSVPGASDADIAALVASGLLLTYSAAASLYEAARRWVRHDWYLSLLAHLEVLAHARSRPAISALASRKDYLPDLDVLAARRTTRVFDSAPITVEELQTLLERALAGSDVSALRWLRVFLAPLAVRGLAPVIHEWNHHAAVPTGTAITREAVQDLTTGQVSAGDGACALWLLAGLDTSDPAAYELGLVELGRIGQRLCLTATDLGLGVFLTPAVKDREVLATLGVPADPTCVAYVFSIGHPAAAP